MPNLLETIQQNRAAMAGQPAPLEDQTAKVQNLLRAKSGRAVTSGDAATSNLGEQGAVAGTQAQLGQLAGQAQVQTQNEKVQQAGQKQQEQEQRQAIDQAKKFDTVQNRIQTQGILQNLSQNKGSLDLEKQQAGMEQASFLLSMQDKSYTDTLQDIGKRRRLDDQAAFQNEMQQVAFGDNLAILKQKLGDKDVLTASDRDFKKAMSDINIQDALQIASIEETAAGNLAAMERQGYGYQAQQQAKMANTAAQSQGLSGLLSGVTSAAGTAMNTKSTPVGTTSIGKTDTAGTSGTGNIA